MHGVKKAKQEYVFFILSLLGLTLLVFRQVLVPGQFLFTSDDNIGSLLLRQQWLPQAWWGGWSDQELLGQPSLMFFNLTNLLLFVFPAGFFNNWINAFDLAVGSFFLYLYLRGRGLAWPACVLGVLTAYWVGSNLTLVYAGHIGKFGILLWVPCFLWLTDSAIRKSSVSRAMLAGGALGAMFLEQADVAFFFALALGPYALFAWWRTHGLTWTTGARILGPLFLTAFLLAVHPLLGGYRSAVEGVAAVQQDEQAKWEFITQWSWPPEESIDFIAPGYTGWRSGEPTGPYTGRMGRSPGWEETGQGFRNFKLENQYLGAIPLLFAVAAVYAAMRRRHADRKEIAFWGVVTVVALLLAFGKYFPLYTLFYQLPFVSSIRNPNKFLQLFQFALAICTAYGVEACWAHTTAGTRRINSPVDWRPVWYGALALAGILLFASFSAMARSDRIAAALQAEWGHYASTIAANRVPALLHGGVMTVVAAVGLFLLTRTRTTRRMAWITVIALIAVMVLDVIWLARHYVKTIATGSMATHPVVEAIQAAPDGSRVALVTQEGFYNQWLSVLFPYHGIKTVNVSQMPRMPVDYERYLNAVGRHPLRHWALGGVGWVLAPAEVWGQIAADPGLRGQFDLQLAYAVVHGNGGVRISPTPEPRPGSHVLLHYTAPSPRYALVAGWEILDDATALRRLAAPDFVPFDRIMIAAGQDTAAWPSPNRRGLNGEVQRVDYRPGYVHLNVTAEYPSILRVADKHDPDWQVEVNGHPAPLLRVDYLVQGVYLDAGQHEVILRYAPPITTLWVQVAGMSLVWLALLLAIRNRFNHLRTKHAS